MKKDMKEILSMDKMPDGRLHTALLTDDMDDVFAAMIELIIAYSVHEDSDITSTMDKLWDCYRGMYETEDIRTALPPSVWDGFEDFNHVMDDFPLPVNDSTMEDIPSDVLKLVSYQFLKQVAENEGKSMEAVARDILQDEKYHGNAPEIYQS